MSLSAPAGTVVCGECGTPCIVPANLREQLEENAQLREQLQKMALRLQEIFPYEATLKDLADKLRTDSAHDRELLVFVNDRFLHWSPK